MVEAAKEVLLTSIAVAIGVFWGLFLWFVFLFCLDIVLQYNAVVRL